MSNKKKTNTKYLKLGTYQTVIALVVIGIAIILNLVVSKLPKSITQLDTSADKIFTLSDTTEKIVQNLDEDITLYLIAETDSVDDRIETLLNRYKGMSSHISVEMIDPNSHPGFAAKYTDESLSSNSVIAVSGSGKSVAINYSSIYTVDPNLLSETEQQYYSYYGASAVSPNTFNGESEVTSAIDRLQSGTFPIVYELQGHGEVLISQFNSDLASGINTDNITLAELKLTTTDAVPDDASAVIINDPTNDIANDELTKLQTYMDNGGNVILVTLPGMLTQNTTDISEMKNLLTLANAYGMTAKAGMLCEGDTERYAASYGNSFLIPQINTSSEIYSKMSSGVDILMPYSGAILEAEQMPENIEVTPLLTTSSSAYITTNANSTEKTDTSETGSFYIGAEGKNAKTGARMIWYSSYYIEGSLSSYGYGNDNMFLATLLSVTGKEGSSISLAGKSIKATSLKVTQQANNIWGNVVTIGIPVILIIAGMIVILRRRKK